MGRILRLLFSWKTCQRLAEVLVIVISILGAYFTLLEVTDTKKQVKAITKHHVLQMEQISWSLSQGVLVEGDTARNARKMATDLLHRLYNDCLKALHLVKPSGIVAVRYWREVVYTIIYGDYAPVIGVVTKDGDGLESIEIVPSPALDEWSLPEYPDALADHYRDMVEDLRKISWLELDEDISAIRKGSGGDAAVRSVNQKKE